MDQTTPPPAPDENQEQIELNASNVRALALKNLKDRLVEGDRLTENDWARIERMAEEEKPDPLNDTLKRLEEENKKPRKRIPVKVAELAKLALVAKHQQHIWADVNECAAELKVSIQTVRNYCGEFGIEHDRTAIVKADMYRGLWMRELERFEKHKSAEDQKEQQLRIQEREARIAARTGVLEDNANTMAMECVIRLLNDISGDIYHNWPPQITNIQAETQTKDALELQGHFHRFFKKEINAMIGRIIEELPPEKAAAIMAEQEAAKPKKPKNKKKEK